MQIFWVETDNAHHTKHYYEVFAETAAEATTKVQTGKLSPVGSDQTQTINVTETQTFKLELLKKLKPSENQYCSVDVCDEGGVCYTEYCKSITTAVKFAEYKCRNIKYSCHIFIVDPATNEREYYRSRGPFTQGIKCSTG